MSEKNSAASLNKTAFKAGIFYIVAQLFVRGITFFMTPVFTRLLSQEQFNQYKLFESWLLIFGPVMSLCLWRSVERAKYDVKEKFNEYVSSVQTLSYLSITVFFAAFLILREPVKQLSSMTGLVLSDFMLIIAFLYTYAHTSIFYFQRREKQMMRYKASTAFTAATVVPATLLSVLLVVWGRTNGHTSDLLSLRIAGYYIPMVIGGLGIGALMLIQGKKAVDLHYWKYALCFSLPLIPEVLSIQIMNQADKVMVSAMSGSVCGSILALATTVSYIIWILEDSVWNAWLPWMYEKIARGEGHEIRPNWTVLMHAFGAVSFALVLFAPEIIWILGGSKYRDAVYLVAPMVTGTLFRLLHSYPEFSQKDGICRCLYRISHVFKRDPQLYFYPSVRLSGSRLYYRILLSRADVRTGLYGKTCNRYAAYPSRENTDDLLFLVFPVYGGHAPVSASISSALCGSRCICPLRA